MLRQKFQHLPTNISVINISHQPQRKFHLNMQISFPPHKNRGADGVLGLTFQLFAAFHKKWFEKRVGSGLKANTLIEKFTHIPHPLWKCCMYAGMLTIANIVGQLWQAIKFRLGQHFVAQLAESASDLQAAKRRSTPGWQQTSHQQQTILERRQMTADSSPDTDTFTATDEAKSQLESEAEQMCQKMLMIIRADTLLNTHPPRWPR